MESDDYGKLRKAILEVEAKADSLKNFVEKLESNLHSLRGLVNRKINYEPEEKSENLNNPVILPDNGSPFKR